MLIENLQLSYHNDNNCEHVYFSKVTIKQACLPNSDRAKHSTHLAYKYFSATYSS